MVSCREVRVVYLAEMRMALRDRTILINSILIPIFLYPLILWAVFSGITFVQGQTEGFVSRVGVVGLAPAHAELRRQMERDDRFKVVDVSAEAAAPLIRSGDLDALLEAHPTEGTGAALADNVSFRLTCDTSKERSASARERVADAVARFRETWLAREATARSIGRPIWAGFTISEVNVASERQMGAFLLSLMLPLFFVIMVAIGCFHPAVDSTAGERERHTWETLMSSGASRASIVVAKYLYVASFGCLAGLLNMIAMVVSMKPVLGPLLAKSGESLEFTVPLPAIPVMAMGGVLLAAFVAAGMMIFAAFARTFKEGQSMITPFYMIILMPAMFLQVPGITFSFLLACIPVVNLTMMVREAISGVFHWPQIAVSVAVSLAAVVVCLRLATVILRFEDVVMGSYGGSLNSFLKERLLKKKASTPHTLGVD